MSTRPQTAENLIAIVYWHYATLYHYTQSQLGILYCPLLHHENQLLSSSTPKVVLCGKGCARSSVVWTAKKESDTVAHTVHKIIRGDL
jgi:hypothetical protein